MGQVDTTKLPLDYLARRDVYMAENLTALVGPAERAAFWAHDGHVINDVPAALADKGFTSIGWETGKRLGSAYRTVGFTYSRATVLTRRVTNYAPDLTKPSTDEPIPLVNDRPQDAGSVFGRLPGDAWWIDVATAPADPAVSGTADVARLGGRDP